MAESNNGPSTATSVLVSDTLPAGIASDSWSGTDGSSGAGPINDTIGSLAVGGTVTYTVIASVSPSATGTLSNTVTVSTANDTNSSNNTATDTDTLTPQVDVGVTKVDNKGGFVDHAEHGDGGSGDELHVHGGGEQQRSEHGDERVGERHVAGGDRERQLERD